MFYYSAAGVISKIVSIKHYWLALKRLFQRICKRRMERLNVILYPRHGAPLPPPPTQHLSIMEENSRNRQQKSEKKSAKTEQHKRKRKFMIKKPFFRFRILKLR